jgi:hypothetical protein
MKKIQAKHGPIAAVTTFANRVCTAQTGPPFLLPHRSLGRIVRSEN